ncbi:hypothetical protein MMC08_004503 [Hypocenomyce scalaris]|nr:hypothetical protein [Hypocenomyce scalaris]
MKLNLVERNSWRSPAQLEFATHRTDKPSIWQSVRYNLPPTPPAELFEECVFDQAKDQPLKAVTTTEEPLVAVIGVGYVGLHLVTAFAPVYKVIAFDISKERVDSIAVQLDQFPSITLTSNRKQLANATHFLIAVPTSLLANKRINTSYLEDAINTVASYARPGATVVIESSVSVGMTRQLLEPLMRSRGLHAGMSPERVDPGRTEPPMESIPKIISGLDDITPGSLDSINTLYSRVFRTVVTVSKPEVAEMMKLYENCQRLMCIAYANEMADACRSHGIDPFEVSTAASTKPFGYMPFAPSLGVGGPCIPVNPFYLLTNNTFPLLQLATELTWQRPSLVGSRAMASLIQDNPEKFSKKRRPRVLVVGAGFKKGQSNITCSPSVELMKDLLEAWDALVCFADPLVKATAIPYVPRLDEHTEWNKTSLEWYDLIIVAVKQDGLDLAVLENLHDVRVEMWCQ